VTPLKREEVPMMKTLGVVLISALAAPSSVLAQAVTVGAGQSAVAQVVASSASSSGLRESIDREAARLAQDQLGAAAVQPQNLPERSWAGRHPVALGAMIGAAGGVVWGGARCSNSCDGEPYLAMPAGAIVGAGIGAGVGALISLITR